MREILIFYGPVSKFEEVVKNHQKDFLSLYEILEISRGLLNKGRESTIKLKEYYESIIVRSTDFANLSETGEKIIDHMLLEFIRAFNIKYIFLQNPTKTIEKIIKLMVENNLEEFNLVIQKYDYPRITKEHLLKFHQNYSKEIIGQEVAKADLLNTLYRLYKRRNKGKPIVLMFYGPSGVGKTESAKFFSEILESDNLFRLQMSMYQNNKSLDYLFGEEHNAQSLALDLLERESNVLLLDEFDKANPVVYSAFYQMFDEGVFEDRNYLVNLRDSIIICTSNYVNENEIRNKVGAPLFYRFDKLINFQSLKKEDVLKMIDIIFEKACLKLDNTELLIVKHSGLLKHVKNNVDKLILQGNHNYRQINNLIEDMIDSLLVDNLINEIKRQ